QRRGIDHALYSIFEIGRGHRPAIAETHVVAKMKGEYGSVRRRLPRDRNFRMKFHVGVAIAHQRVEDRLLEGPRGGVVARSRIEARHVVVACEPKHLRAGRKSKIVDRWLAARQDDERHRYDGGS